MAKKTQNKTEADGVEIQAAAPISKPIGVTVAPAVGAMVHPFLNAKIDGPTTFASMDSWLDVQIAAGKLLLQ